MPRGDEVHRPNTITAEELGGYFASAESDAGLSSGLAGCWNRDDDGHVVWAPPQGGRGGDPEARRVDAFDRRRKAITSGRLIRRALITLPPRVGLVLFAAFGPTPWVSMLDASFGRGMGAKVTRRLGDVLGVALVTPEVTTGFASAEEALRAPLDEGELVLTTEEGSGRADAWRRDRIDRPRSHARWHTVGGYLVSLCLENGTPRLARVRAAAAQLLAVACDRYHDARLAGDPSYRQALARSAAIASRPARVRRSPSMLLGG
jgi:hypothetical protein